MLTSSKVDALSLSFKLNIFDLVVEGFDLVPTGLLEQHLFALP